MLAKIAVLKNALSEIYHSSPRQSFLLLGVLLINGVLPPLSIYALSSIIGKISYVTSITSILPDIGLWLFTITLPSLISSILLIQQSSLSEKLFQYLSIKLMLTTRYIKDLNALEKDEIYNDIDIIKTNISNRPVNLVVTVAGIFSDSVSLILLFASLITITWISPLTAMILGIIFFYIASKSQSSLWSGSLKRSLQSRMMSYLFSLSLDKISIPELRIHHACDFLIKKFRAEYQTTRSTMNKVRLYVFKLSFLSFFLAILAGLIMVWDVLRIIEKSNAAPGQIVFLLQAILLIQMKTRSFSEQLGWLGSHLLFFEKYFSFLQRASPAATEKINTKPAGQPFGATTINSISLNHCTFGYANRTPVINNYTLKIRQGEKVALVGANGSGKTTITRLLLGLYKPQQGQLHANDTMICEENIDDYWAKCTFISQEYAKFHFLIEENVLLGHSQNFLNQHIEKSLGGDLWQTRHTQLGSEFNGVDISGGQWQKLALLRAINNCTEKDILIFDEPTSSIDPLMEGYIYDLIDQISENKIVVYVTHRMASIKQATRIIFMENGSILADGSHDNLYNNCSSYRDMYDAQAKRFICQ